MSINIMDTYNVSSCTTCGGGISRQQKRCRRKPCKGRTWNYKYKICNLQPCSTPTDPRAEQCATYDNRPYSEQLFKWYPYYDPSRPCALICRGERQNNISPLSSASKADERVLVNGELGSAEEYTESTESIVAQLADKVQDGTKCYPGSHDVCINGECQRVGCDLKVGSNKNKDACGICGGDGSTCDSKYAWTLESTSACSESCGGGFKIVTPMCKSTGPDSKIVDNSMCEPESKPDKLLLPCNTLPCSTKWLTGEWSKCSVSCGGGSRSRPVFCTEENGNATSKIPEYKCNVNHKPKFQEICNAFSCPMWEAGEWSECSTSCGKGVKTRSVECRDGKGRLSNECDRSQQPRAEIECKGASSDCSSRVQDLIITCVRDDTGKTVMPLLCSADTKPESRIRVCNDHPCPPRWNTSEFSPCMSPCGLGIQTREVNCIHEVTRGTGNTVVVPNHMCPQPPPVDRQYCNVWDCPVQWSVGEWGKCSKTCGGGVKKRKVICEQVMAQGRKQTRAERDCPTPRPRTEKECNSRPCDQANPAVKPIITSKNVTFVQEDPDRKVNLDIGGQATIFQGTPVIKIRCPVKKFDKAHIVWRKDHEELRKSRKYKINKKGALKIVDINFSDSGVYSCWDNLIFEWVTTDWSRCSQSCGGGGFQMRGAQCTVRSVKNDTNDTKMPVRTVMGPSLCEDAGLPVPEKVRACGTGKCPQWHTTEWSSCETSRCFNWKTAMQRREISCRLAEETSEGVDISTVVDMSKCDESMRPPQRQECYNDACKGVWRVGEWSECSASCEEDGIKYRILQCVWYGTKKPAGNVCRNLPRPPVMKTCRGPPCAKSSDDCKDHSKLCGRVKLMGMCRVPLYAKQCCNSCHQDKKV
ncbi:unnamed protein product [Trichogramma brassicae]|uniref:PLAC domain-containing protein n=1 Tax=Trichogramma brassicae TaxID=86971 RepID=A0A6H5IDE6_9HYME|nr:unnamed protein product [Trichogramma brassicae]